MCFLESQKINRFRRDYSQGNRAYAIETTIGCNFEFSEIARRAVAVGAGGEPLPDSGSGSVLNLHAGIGIVSP